MAQPLAMAPFSKPSNIHTCRSWLKALWSVVCYLFIFCVILLVLYCLCCIRSFQIEQLTPLNFDAFPTACSINRGWKTNKFSKQSDERWNWVPSTAQIGKVYWGTSKREWVVREKLGILLRTEQVCWKCVTSSKYILNHFCHQNQKWSKDGGRESEG